MFYKAIFRVSDFEFSSQNILFFPQVALKILKKKMKFLIRIVQNKICAFSLICTSIENGTVCFKDAVFIENQIIVSINIKLP